MLGREERSGATRPDAANITVGVSSSEGPTASTVSLALHRSQEPGGASTKDIIGCQRPRQGAGIVVLPSLPVATPRPDLPLPALLVLVQQVFQVSVPASRPSGGLRSISNHHKNAEEAQGEDKRRLHLIHKRKRKLVDKNVSQLEF